MKPFKLVVDSCCELLPILRDELDAESVPLSLFVDEHEYIDDDNLDINEFLTAMNTSSNPPKSACPSPASFAEKCKDAVNTFIVTLSSKLSGSHNSACIAKDLVNDNNEGNVVVIDSKSASAGELLISLKLMEFVKNNLPIDDIVANITAFIRDMQTLFVLDNLSTLIKTGRVNKIVGNMANVLKIKPIMGSDGDGNIILIKKTIGSKNALIKMVETIGEKCVDTAEKILVITHCNNSIAANMVRDLSDKMYSFKNIHVVKTGGTSSMYANDGGVVIAF